jgi:hypothetical protein
VPAEDGEKLREEILPKFSDEEYVLPPPPLPSEIIQWSPDGRKLAIGSCAEDCDASGLCRLMGRLYIFSDDVMWRKEYVLIDAANTPLAWSPDGEALAVAQNWGEEVPTDSGLIEWEFNGDIEVIIREGGWLFADLGNCSTRRL